MRHQTGDAAIEFNGCIFVAEIRAKIEVKFRNNLSGTSGV